MSSTYFVENLNVSADSTLGGDIIFTNVTNDLTVDIASQATGTATVTIPDLGGVAGQLLAPLLASGTDNKVIRMNGTTGVQESTNVTLTDADVFEDVVGVTALAGGDLTITAASTQDVVVALDAGQNMTVTGGGVTIAEDLLVSGDAVITGDLTVNGTTTSVDSTNVLIADNNMVLSSNYTTAVAREGGFAVNYLPTATASTTASTNFTTTTVEVAAIGAFVATDIILVSGSADPSNNGLFEILSTALNVITIDPTPTHNFLNSVFVADGADTGADVTKVTVAILQAGTDGRFEVASGSDTSLVFTDLALVTELPSGTWTEVDINTTNATPDATTLISITVAKSATLEVIFSARQTTGTNALNGKLLRPFENTTTTVSAMGLGTRDESRIGTTTGWTIASSGNASSQMIITVTGAAATVIDWRILYRSTESP